MYHREAGQLGIPGSLRAEGRPFTEARQPGTPGPPRAECRLLQGSQAPRNQERLVSSGWNENRLLPFSVELLSLPKSTHR